MKGKYRGNRNRVSKSQNSFSKAFLKFRFNVKARISIYKKLRSYTEAQFAIYDTLVKLKERYDIRKDPVGKIMGYWIDSLNKGVRFDKALEGWVPNSEINLIASGLDGEGIEYGLGEAIKIADSSRKIKNTIIGGAMYPVVMLFVIFGFIAMFSVQMAPTYLSILPLESWPSSARVLYHISDGITKYWYIFLLVAFAFGFLVSITIGSWTGKTREFFDRFPPWSIYRAYQSSSFLISLSSMMNSGTPVNTALGKIKNHGSGYLNSYITEMERNFKKGNKNFGKNLDVGLLEEEAAGDIIIYSELGTFEKAVYEIGDQSLIDSVETIDKRMSVIKNIMILLVGIIVLWIYMTNNTLSSSIAEAAANFR